MAVTFQWLISDHELLDVQQKVVAQLCHRLHVLTRRLKLRMVQHPLELREIDEAISCGSHDVVNIATWLQGWWIRGAWFITALPRWLQLIGSIASMIIMDVMIMQC